MSEKRTNHLCYKCQFDCDCAGLHMVTDCTGCSLCVRGSLRRPLSDSPQKLRMIDAAQMASTTPAVTRWIVRLFARRFNHVASRVFSRAWERGVITSEQMHYLCAQFDPTQSGVVGMLRARVKVNR
jgi:hypothetical protein